MKLYNRYATERETQGEATSPDQYIAKVRKDKPPLEIFKELYDHLKESSGFVEDIIESNRDGISIVDDKGVHLYVNPAFCHMTGFTREEIIGTGVPHLYWPEEEYKNIQLTFRKSMKCEFHDFEHIFKRKNGERFPVIVSPSVITNKQGDVLLFFATIKDITELKKIENLEKKQAEIIARKNELRRSRTRILYMQESLRKEIAQQIHGTIQNRLIITANKLTKIQDSCQEGHKHREISDARQILTELIESQVRVISHRLYPHILCRGIVPAIQSLIDNIDTNQLIKLEVSKKFEQEEKNNTNIVGEQTRLVIYRIVEEALMNAIKHAKSSNINVELKIESENMFNLTVQDDGQGFSVSGFNPGLGTAMIMDYAAAVDGECALYTSPNIGTAVMADIPFHPKHEEGYQERTQSL